MFLVHRPDAALSVDVDIIPRDSDNEIDLGSRGPIPVAVLGSDSFDVADVDPATLGFGPNRIPPATQRDASVPSLPHPSNPKDVNDDGYPDLVAWFYLQDSGIICGDDAAELVGEKHDGGSFSGSDVIVTTGCGQGETTRPPFRGRLHTNRSGGPGTEAELSRGD
jgi:hypothetical protein